ncbi:MAG: hypothetical protein GX279_00665 [Clostridiaceae bacterium]|jgi:predicted nucleic acid-binding protein|nr:hypothetical protein [Clostridiaceae bacterium]
MSGRFNRKTRANTLIAHNALMAADAAIAANAAKLDMNGIMTSDDPALLTVII